MLPTPVLPEKLFFEKVFIRRGKLFSSFGYAKINVVFWFGIVEEKEMFFFSPKVKIKIFITVILGALHGM